MARLSEAEQRRQEAVPEGSVVRIAVALLPLAATLAALWFGFIFLRDSQATQPKIVTAIFAVVWGVGGVAGLFVSANLLVEQLGDAAKSYLRPFIFVGPAIFMLGWFLFLPTLRLTSSTIGSDRSKPAPEVDQSELEKNSLCSSVPATRPFTDSTTDQPIQ